MSNEENLEEPSVVVDKRLNNTWRLNVTEAGVAEDNTHLTVQHNTTQSAAVISTNRQLCMHTKHTQLLH